MAKSNQFIIAKQIDLAFQVRISKSRKLSHSAYTAWTRTRINTNPYPFWNIAQAPSPDQGASIIDLDKTAVLASLQQMGNIHGRSGSPNEGLKYSSAKGPNE